MALRNNPKIEKHELEALHADAFGWALFCSSYDPELARDVLQQSYLKVVEGSAPYSGQSALKTWLYGVIRLTCMEMRRKPRLVIEDDDVEAIVDIDSGADDALLQEFNADLVERALNRLIPAQREVVYLAFFKEMPLREIAGILGVSLGTVSTQYHRAKSKIRDFIKAEPEGRNVMENLS